MQCVNNHKFCHSCLLVWSTTGQYANRIRCPVCRTHGYYFRNNDVDDRIGAKKVKCLLESCSWSGLLKYLCSHRHTTYGDGHSPANDDSTSTPIMPRLAQASTHIPVNSTSRFSGTGLSTQGSSGLSLARTPRFSRVGSHYLSRESPSPLSSSSQETVVELPRQSNISRSIHRPLLRRIPDVRSSNNRIIFSHTGPNTDSNNNIEDTSPPLSDRSNLADVSDAMMPLSSTHTPRPPTGPRTATSTASSRRLPRIINPPPTRRQHSEPQAAYNPRPRPAPENLGEIRNRLQESRSRLDNLMTSFSGELDRSRQEMAEFHQERERQRREQLEEVRELGQRLGQVASELRRLLEHRRYITSFSDDEVDDEDE